MKRGISAIHDRHLQSWVPSENGQPPYVYDCICIYIYMYTHTYLEELLASEGHIPFLDMLTMFACLF